MLNGLLWKTSASTAGIADKDSQADWDKADLEPSRSALPPSAQPSLPGATALSSATPVQHLGELQDAAGRGGGSTADSARPRSAPRPSVGAVPLAVGAGDHAGPAELLCHRHPVQEIQGQTSRSMYLLLLLTGFLLVAKQLLCFLGKN